MRTFTRYSVLLVLAAGCGAAPEAATSGAPAASDEPNERVASTQEFATATPVIPPEIKLLSEYAGNISTIYGGAQTALQIMQLLNILPTPPSTQEMLDHLEGNLELAIGALSWQAAEIALSQRHSRAVTAAEGARGMVAAGSNPIRWGDQDNDSRSAVLEQLDSIAYKRSYLENYFLNTISTHLSEPSDPPRTGDGNGLVYDWRLGVPALMELVALRLEVIAAINPDFRHSADQEILDEMVQYRENLLKHYWAMVRGVRCVAEACYAGDSNADIVPLVAPNRVDCLDIYTGENTHWEDSFVTNSQGARACPSGVNLNDFVEFMQTRAYNKMPLFRMRQMIDALYMYANPGLKDLTEVASRIPEGHDWPTGNPFCIDVQNGGFAAGTPLWLYWCTGNYAQSWVYDRHTGQIRNPIIGRCMRYNPNPGRDLTIQDCAANDPQEMWSYDPTSQMLLNGAFTPMLALNSGPLSQPGSMLKMYSNSGEGVAQHEEWHADQ